MRSLTTVLLISSIAAMAQSTPPAFEVASIKVSQPGREDISVKPGSLTMRNIGMKGCLRWAYDVQDIQISGPVWMDDIWVDIFAKTAEPATESQMREMLKTLLAERFKLTTHRETKEVPALILTIAKNGHKLKAADKPGNPSFSTGKMTLTGDGATIAELTGFLSHELREAVIDQTGLKGLYSFTLDVAAYVTEEMRKSDGPPPEANSIVAEAMQAQLGLKVEAKKTPVPMLMVDHVEKAPIEN
jgi:uncharacterized protein (TIGR03435 family)